MASRLLLLVLASTSRAAPAICPDWCNQFVCDGSAWCLDGKIPRPCKPCAAVALPASLTFSCDDARCTSVGHDCCAPSSLAEEATCSGGYVPVMTRGGCFDFIDGAYKCCTSSALPPLPPPKPYQVGGSTRCYSPRHHLHQPPPPIGSGAAQLAIHDWTAEQQFERGGGDGAHF